MRICRVIECNKIKLLKKIVTVNKKFKKINAKKSKLVIKNS